MKLERPQALIVLGLIISVLLNVFLVGFLVASHLDLRQRSPAVIARVPPNDGGPGPMRRLFADHRQEFGDARRQIRTARRHVSDALLADPFVAADLDKSLKELQDTTQAAQSTLHQMLLQRAPELSQEERQDLARSHRLWSGDRHRRHHRHHHPFGPEPATAK